MPNKTRFIQSASVILLREIKGGIEVLMLKKNSKITYGDTWVFPGGRVDEQDISPSAEEDFESERNTALRECEEETGLKLNPHKFEAISRWRTPPNRPKRFNAVFFLYQLENSTATIQIDHGEIVDFQWITPSEALQLNSKNKLLLAAPAFVTLSQLAHKTTISEAFSYYKKHGFTSYNPRIQTTKNGVIALYKEDDCYDLVNENEISKSPSTQQKVESFESPHRLYMHKDKPWQYLNLKQGIG